MFFCSSMQKVQMLVSFLLYKLGGFYQDEMGQIDCKRCSLGTYVSRNYIPAQVLLPVKHAHTVRTDVDIRYQGVNSNHDDVRERKLRG